MGTLAAALERLFGPERTAAGSCAPATPPGAKIVLPAVELETVTDETLPASALDDAQLAGAALFIHYRDANGTSSARRIIVQRVSESHGDLSVRARCLERGAMRTFLASRILQLTDLGTGEIADDPRAWFDARRVRPLPRGRRPHGNDPVEGAEDTATMATAMAIKDHRDALIVMIFIARADGRMVAAERSVMIEYVLARSGGELNRRQIEEACAGLYPTFDIFVESAGRLIEHKAGESWRSALSAAEAVAAADGHVTAGERMLIEELRRLGGG